MERYLISEVGEDMALIADSHDKDENGEPNALVMCSRDFAPHIVKLLELGDDIEESTGVPIVNIDISSAAFNVSSLN